ncbi:MAG: hypothetical protein IPM22_09940 [Betaproteobacteria bacterium]|nr:hypothetical protein [Betaproteobacteria bacterium]MCC7218943.1 hypothetical protein [Burkholderiales bacterium]
MARIARLLSALAAFVVLSLVPWLAAASAWLLAAEFRDAGRDTLGQVFAIAAVAIAALTAIGTLWFAGVWLVALVRGDRDAGA